MLLAAFKVIGTIGNLTVMGVPDDLALQCLSFPNVRLLLWHLAFRKALLVNLFYPLRDVSFLETSR